MDGVNEGLLDKILKRFSKKELLSTFVFIDLIIVIILLISIKVSDSNEIINLVSFAGNVASILLALVAIIYAFLQSYATQEVLNKITEKVEGVIAIREKVFVMSDQIAQIASTVSEAGKESVQLMEMTKDPRKVPPDVSKAILSLSEKVDVLGNQAAVASATASTALTDTTLMGASSAYEIYLKSLQSPTPPKSFKEYVSGLPMNQEDRRRFRKQQK